MPINRNKNHVLSYVGRRDTWHMARPVAPRKAISTPNPDACTRVTLGKGRPKGAWGMSAPEGRVGSEGAGCGDTNY